MTEGLYEIGEFSCVEGELLVALGFGGGDDGIVFTMTRLSGYLRRENTQESHESFQGNHKNRQEREFIISCYEIGENA